MKPISRIALVVFFGVLVGCLVSTRVDASDETIVHNVIETLAERQGQQWRFLDASDVRDDEAELRFESMLGVRRRELTVHLYCTASVEDAEARFAALAASGDGHVVRGVGEQAMVWSEGGVTVLRFRQDAVVAEIEISDSASRADYTPMLVDFARDVAAGIHRRDP